jgi:cytochrome c biogenesis factor
MKRLRLWPEIAATWGSALGALYLHVALWALFAVLLMVFVTYEVRSWKAR